VTDDTADTLFALDLLSGDFEALDGEGPRLMSPNGVAYDAGRAFLLVVDGARGALLAVDPGTGARVIVSK
jgi:hypothetical protein